MHIGQRIKRLMKAKGILTKDMAAFCNITPGAVSSWASTGRISKENLAKAASLLGITTDALISGDLGQDVNIHDPSKQGGSDGRMLPAAIPLDNNPDYPSIRRVHFKLSAGASGFGVEYHDEEGAPIVFQRQWYEGRGLRPEKLFAVKVVNGSMEPGLYGGDTVVVNTESVTPKDGVVFAVNYEGEMVIKRLVRDGGQWWLSSDNPDQRRYPRKVCDEHSVMIGEIVHKQSERI